MQGRICIWSWGLQKEEYLRAMVKDWIDKDIKVLWREDQFILFRPEIQWQRKRLLSRIRTPSHASNQSPWVFWAGEKKKNSSHSQLALAFSHRLSYFFLSLALRESMDAAGRVDRPRGTCVYVLPSSSTPSMLTWREMVALSKHMIWVMYRLSLVVTCLQIILSFRSARSCEVREMSVIGVVIRAWSCQSG